MSLRESVSVESMSPKNDCTVAAGLPLIDQPYMSTDFLSFFAQQYFGDRETLQQDVSNLVRVAYFADLPSLQYRACEKNVYPKVQPNRDSSA